MEALFSLCIGVLTGCGTYLLLRARTFPVIMGLILLAYAVNLFLFAMGGLVVGEPAVIGQAEDHADPVPQALVLTAIVIGFAMTAYAVVLSLRARGELGHDSVDDHDQAGGDGE